MLLDELADAGPDARPDSCRPKERRCEQADDQPDAATEDCTASHLTAALSETDTSPSSSLLSTTDPTITRSVVASASFSCS